MITPPEAAVPQPRRSLRDAEGIYRRALGRLANGDDPTSALAETVRALIRWCGAQLAVLMVVTADGALVPEYAVGRSAYAVGREITSRPVPAVRKPLRQLTVCGHCVLAVPLETPAGFGGLLVIGVRHPRTFNASQRAQLRRLVPIASVAVQLKKLRQPATVTRRHSTGGPRRLSQRERGVVALLLAGKSVKETAAALGLSRRTVETYLERLRQRYRQPRLHALLAHLVRVGVA
jgi:DNA-binding CsgD family transcriptional regulator